MRTLSWTSLAALAALSLTIGGCSCDDGGSGTRDGDVPPGVDASARPDGSTAGMDANLPDVDGGPGGPIVRGDGGVEIVEDGGFTWTCVPVSCSGRFTECGDCIDNDGDGRTDSRDQECLGPCDNTEGPALTTGVGGEGGASCNRDCYFDFGNGSGNDDCRWDTLCDPNQPDSVCPYDEGELGGRRCPAAQSDMCLSVCRPITPNGCDCFGCCTFDALAGRAEADGGEWVWLGSGVGEGEDGEGTCTFELIEDTDACRPCEPVADCFNDCGRCELCLGRTTLPDECLAPRPDAGGPYDSSVPRPDAGDYPPPRCPPDIQPCGLPDDPACPLDYYCVTGCCQPTLI